MRTHLDLSADDKEAALVIWNVHVDHVDAQARDEVIDALKNDSSLAKESPLTHVVLIGGDFNARAP
eukprot:5385111-Karenia_brevis.AAC.1